MTDGDGVMIVNMMPQFMPENKLEFIMIKRFQQARGKHDKQAAILWFKAHGVKLGTWKNIEFQRRFNFKGL